VDVNIKEPRYKQELRQFCISTAGRTPNIPGTYIHFYSSCANMKERLKFMSLVHMLTKHSNREGSEIFRLKYIHTYIHTIPPGPATPCSNPMEKDTIFCVLGSCISINGHQAQQICTVDAAVMAFIFPLLWTRLDGKYSALLFSGGEILVSIMRCTRYRACT
jgi:hypothetical protein